MHDCSISMLTCRSVVLFVRLSLLHMPISAVTTAPISSVCRQCGVVPKSGKLNCCARGGSWFGKCVSVGRANFGHKWYEGVRTCKTPLPQGAFGLSVHASQPKSNTSRDDTRMGKSFNAIIVAAHMFESTRTNTSVSTATVTSVRVPASTLISTSDRTSAGYNIGTTTSSKTITTTMKKIINVSVNMSMAKLTSPPVSGTIPLLRQSVSVIVPTKSLSHTSASTAITTRKCEKLFHVVSHISMVLIVVYLY